jgi:hypothetical protein
MAGVSPSDVRARRTLHPVDPAPGLTERIRVLDAIVTQLSERVEILEARGNLDLSPRPRTQGAA